MMVVAVLEATIQKHILIAAGNAGATLYRNNTGACQDNKGNHIRYGLCNDSAQLNQRLKSADLVGWMPKLVTPADVGRVLAVFAAVEVKAPGWHMTPSDKRAQAQERWLRLVQADGGFAGFAQSVGDAERILRGSL